MEKRKKRDHDFSVTAFRVVQEATGQIKLKSTKVRTFNAVASGRLGGLKGGRVRAGRLTSARRIEIARKATGARWSKKRQNKIAIP